MTEKKNTRVIAFANQKGGVSKTSSALNVCYAFTELGKNVLLIDMDSQASASLNLGIDVDEEETGTIDALLQPMITNQVKYRSWAEIQSCIQTRYYSIFHSACCSRASDGTCKWFSWKICPYLS